MSDERKADQQMSIPSILEYATTDELVAELFSRMRLAILIHIPNRREEHQFLVQHRIHGDHLLAYDIIKKFHDSPLRLRASNTKKE